MTLTQHIPLLDLPACRAAAEAMRDRYNAEVREHNRQLAPGEPRRQILRQQVLDTFNRMVHQVGGYLVQHRKRLMLPTRPFVANRSALAAAVDVDVCTIHRHWDRLVEAGFLTERRFRGTDKGVAFQFAPSLLLAQRDAVWTAAELERLGIGEGSTPDQHKAALEELRTRRPTLPAVLFASSVVADCKHTEDRKQQDTDNENQRSGSAAAAVRPAPVLNGQDRKQTDVQRADPQTHLPPAAIPADRPKAPGGAAPEPEADPAIPLMAHRATDWVLPVLWPGRRFSRAERYTALACIAAWFRRFPTIHPEQLASEFAIRCQLTRRYVAREAGRFVPEPSWYFDPTNAKGFEGTRQWYLDELKLERDKRRLRATLGAMADYLQQYAQAPSLPLRQAAERDLGQRAYHRQVLPAFRQLCDAVHEAEPEAWAKRCRGALRRLSLAAYKEAPEAYRARMAAVLEAYDAAAPDARRHRRCKDTRYGEGALGDVLTHLFQHSA